MKRLSTLFLLFLLFTAAAYAQKDSCKYEMSGRVLDIDTKDPIPFATVKVSGEETYSLTNEEGYFELKNLCSDENTLIISCFGYCDTLCQHHHHHGRAPHFYLTQKVQKIETVLIEAEKLKAQGTETMAQETISKSEMNIGPTQSLATTLASVEGVTYYSNGTNAQIPIIHGLYGNRIIVVNNGLKHGFQNWGTGHAPEIDITNANSITVLKGASGVQFGPEALGGAIIVESNPLRLNEPLNVSLGSAYQTNGRGYSTNFGVQQGFKHWSYFINGNNTQVGDRQTPNYVLTNSGKEEQSLSTGVRYRRKKIDAKVHYSYVNQNLAFLRASIAESPLVFIKTINAEQPIIIDPFSYEIREPNQEISHHLAKAEVSWWYSEHSKLSFRAGRQWNHRQEFDVRRNEDWPIIDLELATSDYQLEWKHTDKFNLDGLIGIQYFEQENLNNPGTGVTAFIPNYLTRRWSAFIIESKHIGKNIIELGLRLDAENNYVIGRKTNQDLFFDEFDFNNLTASLGIVRNVSDRISFRSNLGTAWRTPNMAELFSFGQHGFKSGYGLLRYTTNDEGRLRTNSVSNFIDSDFDVEKGYKFINELEIKGDKNKHVITAYSHYIQNFVFDRPYTVNQTIRGPMPVFIYDQADAFFLGLDYSWRRNWTDNMEGKLGLSYLHTVNVEERESLINQPPIQINYQLKVKRKDFWVFESSEFSFTPSYTFQQFQAPRTITPEALIFGEVNIDENTEIFDFADAPEGYFLIALAWNFKWNNFTGGIRVENALNTSYRDYLNEMRYFADEPGRNVLFSLNYNFKSNTN